MVVSEGLPFIRDYVHILNEAIKQHAPEHELSRLQRYGLSFVILGLLVTNTLCWIGISRFSLGHYCPAAMSWMFRGGKIVWEALLYASVAKILASYNLNKGIVAIDDSDVERSRQTKKWAYVHPIRDKKRCGFFKGQAIVFLILVTNKLTIPVGFSFYQPDPSLSAWRKEDKRLRKKGVSKKYRPAKPERDANYPTKREIALTLLKQFTSRFISESALWWLIPCTIPKSLCQKPLI